MRALFGNAELQRNLWLEMTPQRLVVAPLAIILVVLVILASSHDPRTALRTFGSYGFIAATALWGARLAAQSLSEEFADGTWDGQRTSSLSAWAMCLGKIFGGAAFAWYIGAGLLLVFLAGAVTTMAAASLLKTVAGLLLLAVFSQSLSLLLTLLGWRRLRRIADSRHRGLTVLMLLLLLPTVGQLLPWLGQQAITEPLLIWFDRPWPATDFLLASLALFTGWVLLGVHRAMRAELQFRDPPWTWVAFVLFLQVYVAGWIGTVHFDHLPSLQAASAQALLRPLAVVRLVAATAVALLLAYVFVFSEAKERLRYERLLADVRARRLGPLLQSPPLWLVNALIAALTLVVALAAALVALKLAGLIVLATGLLALLAYAVRDFAVVLLCNFGPSRRRADAAAAFYLLALYGLPLALLLATGLGGLSGLFEPLAAFRNPFWLLAALAWAAGGVDLLIRRWRSGRAAT
jgi:hypothetical protein